jgi:hypothetical protein
MYCRLIPLFFSLTKQPNPSSESDAAKARRASSLRDVYTCEHNRSKNNFMKTESNTNPESSKVSLIGSGIAGLARAVCLEKDAGTPGGNIHILEKDSLFNLRCPF